MERPKPTISQQPISDILSDIDKGIISLPVFQRGYVWKKKQVRDFFTSLYNMYPVGSLLIWSTESSGIQTRGTLSSPVSPRQILLDGQQRITSLYGVIRGHEPAFFDGNSNTFKDLRFHIENEVFEYYQPVKMRDDPLWIDVSNLFQQKVQCIPSIIQACQSCKELTIDTNQIWLRVTNLINITQRDLIVETIKDKEVSIVVDIFDRVNSKGTKLSKGDLALAKLCVEWSEARETMQAKLAKWEKSKYRFSREWLLRNVNVITTGKAEFSYLSDVDRKKFQEGLRSTERYIDKSLNIIGNRLGLDHQRVLFANGSIPLIVAFLDKYKGDLTSEQRDKLLYWYVHTGMWGRYSGSSESILNKDLLCLQANESPDTALEQLINLSRVDGHIRKIVAKNFQGYKVSARFYRVLYMLTRMGEAQDFGDGLPLKEHNLGTMSQLERHHIFPQAQLKKFGYSNKSVNAIANFCFLAKESNVKISDRLPSHYLAEVDNKHPRALKSQWIPLERDLWELHNYEEFLDIRRELLAEATNNLLEKLINNQ